MLITDALFGEHAVFYLFLGHIEQALPALDSLSALQHRFATFAFALEAHAGLEDELLFTALEPHLGTQAGPLAVMRFEHDQILFRMARQFLSEDELTSLGGQWAKRRAPLIRLGMHNPCGERTGVYWGNELIRFSIWSFVKSFSFHSYGMTGNDFQLRGFLIVFIWVTMDVTLFGVALNTSFISALQQKEARIGFKNLNELTVFLETWIKDSSEDSQIDFSP